MTAETPQAPKGTIDFLPPRGAALEALDRTFADVARRYGYRRIVTPLFEHSEVYERVGEATDVVRKEMFTFTDRGGRSLTLRPEGTAGVVRAFVEHGLGKKVPLPWKVFYKSACFRYETPQRGRYHQHHQLGVEAIGDEHPDLDIEVIDLAMTFLASAGVDTWVLLLNSMGDRECRPAYLEKFRVYLADRVGELCDECRIRMTLNPLRILDCKRESCRAVTAGAPRLVDNLCPACADHFTTVKLGLDRLGWEYTIEPRLVRGLDYYTRTTFEIQSPVFESAQNALGGGGRYGGLVEELGGAPTPGIGFGLGAERILLVTGDENFEPPVLVAVVDVTSAGALGRELLSRVRGAGLSGDAAGRGRSLKAQLRAAERLGAVIAVIVGDEEEADRTVTVKDLRDGSQNRIGWDDLIDCLQKILGSG